MAIESGYDSRITMKNLVNVVIERYLSPKLAERGFSRRGFEFTREAESCRHHIFIRFDIRRRVCCYYANIEFPQVERLLNYGARAEEASNTIGKQMGYLSSRRAFEEWRIGRLTRARALARRFLIHLERFADPFFERFSSMTAVIEALEGGDYFNLDRQDVFERMAAMQHLLGRKEQAIRTLKDGASEYEGKPQQSRFIKLSSYLEQLSEPTDAKEVPPDP